MNELTEYLKIKKSFQGMINNIFWMLILQGLSFVLMGISVYFYPSIVTWLFIFGFIWLGFTALAAGVKTKLFGNKVDKTMTVFS